MKKNYQKPTMSVVKMLSANIICTSTDHILKGIVTEVSESESDKIEFGGGSDTGGDGTGAHARQQSDWDDEEE